MLSNIAWHMFFDSHFVESKPRRQLLFVSATSIVCPLQACCDRMMHYSANDSCEAALTVISIVPGSWP